MFSKPRLTSTLGHINSTKIKSWSLCLYFKLKQWKAFRALTHTPQAVDFLQSIGLEVSLIEILWQERRIKLLRLSKRTSTLPYIIIITGFLSGRKCSKSLQIQSNKDHWLLKSWVLLPLTESDSYVACLDAACIFCDSVHINLPVTHH